MERRAVSPTPVVLTPEARRAEAVQAVADARRYVVIQDGGLPAGMPPVMDGRGATLRRPAPVLAEASSPKFE